MSGVAEHFITLLIQDNMKDTFTLSNCPCNLRSTSRVSLLMEQLKRVGLENEQLSPKSPADGMDTHVIAELKQSTDT